MQYRQLGRSGLKISPMCLGTMMFGGPTDEATSTRIVAKAREAGINLSIPRTHIQKAIPSRWSAAPFPTAARNWVLATKLANAMGDDPNHGGLSRRWMCCRPPTKA